MKHWREYRNHKRKTYTSTEKGKKIKNDDTIYTFDIETTSVVLHNNKVHGVEYYNTISIKERRETNAFGFMYIWMFGINKEVYYGRTWEEFRIFMSRVFSDKSIRSIVYVHNLAFEMQFLRGVLPITEVFARRNYSPMAFTSENITFRCSYYLTLSSLAKCSELYNLPVSKKVGDLDYSKIRHKNTYLTPDELSYCEYDIITLYHLIEKFREEYKHLKKIPYTKTGVLRRKTKAKMNKEPRFTCKMKDLNTYDPELYNALVDAFAGGYTHTNVFYSNTILHDVESYDICSSYPFVMCCEPVFPQEAWKRTKIKNPEKMQPGYLYILHLKLRNIKSIKQNTTLSFHKCKQVNKNHLLDNGRVERMEKCELVVTNIDYQILKKFYSFECEVVKAWKSPAGYLPKPFIEYILDIYKIKTTYKNVEGKEDEYTRSKEDFNALYGMCVTNDMRDEVTYINDKWDTNPPDILALLKEKSEEKNPFLHFSYGVFITSQARANLLNCVAELDEYNAYSDTDSLKLIKGFDNRVINRYNRNVIRKIIEVKKYTGLSGFTQYDTDGNPHTLGILEKEAVYEEFKAIGAKKYAVKNTRAYENGKRNPKKDKEGITITVAGVPKKEGSKCLTSLEEFKHGFIFKGEETGKLQKFVNEEKDICLTVTDYLGNTEDISFSFGLALVPCDYTLSRSSIMDIEDLDMFILRRHAAI